MYFLVIISQDILDNTESDKTELEVLADGIGNGSERNVGGIVKFPLFCMQVDIKP